MPARHQLGQGKLGLLAAGEGARVLARDVAGEPEHPEQGTQRRLLRVRVLAHLREHRHARADSFVLLGVVAE